MGVDRSTGREAVGTEAGQHSLATEAEQSLPDSNEMQYWNANLRLLRALLAVWFTVSFGAGILFVDVLNRFTLPFSDCPLGFWIAQQGAIYGFCLIVLAYIVMMNRVDSAFGVDEGNGDAGRNSEADDPGRA